MSITELQKFTYISKYAKWNHKTNKRETWDECVNSVRDMHKKKYPHLSIEIDDVFEEVRKKRVLPSQRTLQFGGAAIENKNVRAYNCSASYCDRLRFFQETMYVLLCGCGVGFSVQKQHVARLPKLISLEEMRVYNRQIDIYVVPDTIEGWADSIGKLINSYFISDTIPNGVIFDFSLIRPAGSRLSSGSGKAPGHVPLMNALNKIREILESCLSLHQEYLLPINAYDIIMHMADAVLSGGVRRSSCIALFSYDDEDMLKAKTGNWYYDNPQRQRSNNSIVLVRNKIKYKEFNTLINTIKEYGEPGFCWVDDLDTLTNPCHEIGLYGYDSEGNSGFQFCNLTTINGKKCKNKEDFYKACKIAAFIGTLQAGYTDFDYLGPVSENITKREALLGVSICGMMENPEILLNPQYQKHGANIVREENNRVAKLININPAARCTAIKPDGTVSLMLGSSSGIHPHHARRYIRRVKCNILEAPYQLFKSINPTACEVDIGSANHTDNIILFPIEVAEGAKLKNEISGLELLTHVRDTYKNWIEYGRNKNLCVKPWLTHNISNTVSVKSDEWDDVAKFIFDNRHYFAGVSLLSYSGDKDYYQAPFTAVFLPHEIVRQYGNASIFASGIIEGALIAFNNNLWLACDILLGKGNMECKENQKLWIVKAQQFAQKYFANDIRQMTYCLKDVFNWKLYTDLIRDFKEIDYNNMNEEFNTIDHRENLACAGGACEI